MVGQDFAVHGIGNVAADGFLPVLRADHAFDHGGRYFGKFARRHQDNGGDGRLQVSIDVTHGAFVFIVGSAADAAHHEIGLDAVGEINQKSVVELGNAHIGEFGSDCHQHGFALFQCVGGMLIGIGADGHNKFVKHGLCVADHPQVAVGGGVETAGVNRAAVVWLHSQFCIGQIKNGRSLPRLLRQRKFILVGLRVEAVAHYLQPVRFQVASSQKRLPENTMQR